MGKLALKLLPFFSGCRNTFNITRRINVKLKITVFVGVMLLLLVFNVPVNAQAEQGELEEELVFKAAGSTSYDCELVENGDYYLKYVYLYAGQNILAGRTKITVFRRDGKYTTLRVSVYTTGYGWEILESHLYVGATQPRKMAPGRFPYQQETPSGLDRHDYYVDLDNIGASFEHVYIAIHATVRTTGTKIELPAGQEETAWGFKTTWYPVMDKDEIVNPNGDPWGTIFPKRNKQWPAYFKVYIPYNVENPWFECPQPLLLIFKY